MPEIVFGQDLRILGAADMVSAVAESRLILANPLRKTLVTVGISGTAPNVANAQILVQCESVVLPVSPRVVASNDSYVYALGVDRLFRVANGAGLDTAGYAVTAYTIDCLQPRWLLVHNGFVYTPYEGGGVSVHTAAGVLVRRYDHVLDDGSVAAIDAINSLFYLADGSAGRAVAAEIQADGTLEFAPEFEVPGAKAIVALIPDAAFLVVVCRHRVVLFTTVDPLAPVLTSVTRFTGQTLHDGVRTETGAWWFAATEYLATQADRFDHKNYRAIKLASGLFALSSVSGRIIGEADFTSYRPGDLGGGADTSTHYIFQEDSFGILTETSDLLRQE